MKKDTTSELSNVTKLLPSAEKPYLSDSFCTVISNYYKQKSMLLELRHRDLIFRSSLK